MKKYVALFDWDNTIQTSYAYTTWIDLLLAKNILNQEFLADNQKVLDAYKSGQLNHDDLAIKGMEVFSKHIKGVRADTASSIIDEYKKNNDKFIYPLIKNIVLPFLSANDIEIIVISGSPQVTLDPYREELGISQIYAMNFTVENEKYTGGFPINTGLSTTKEQIVDKILAAGGEILFAFGDSISDIPLLSRAKCGFVNNKKRILEKANIFNLDFRDEAASGVIVEKMKTFLINK